MTSEQIARLIAGYISPALPSSPDAQAWASWVRYVSFTENLS